MENFTSRRACLQFIHNLRRGRSLFVHKVSPSFFFKNKYSNNSRAPVFWRDLEEKYEQIMNRNDEKYNQKTLVYIHKI